MNSLACKANQACVNGLGSYPLRIINTAGNMFRQSTMIVSALLIVPARSKFINFPRIYVADKVLHLNDRSFREILYRASHVFNNKIFE